MLHLMGFSGIVSFESLKRNEELNAHLHGQQLQRVPKVDGLTMINLCFIQGRVFACGRILKLNENINAHLYVQQLQHISYLCELTKINLSFIQKNAMLRVMGSLGYYSFKVLKTQ